MADGQFSSDPDERVKALNELHAQKVRALMKSVNSLKAKITKMTRDNKQNKLAVRIQGMQKQHREMELVVDVLKQMMCERQWSRAEVDNALIKRATGGPKRFRPKIREELELELQQLKNKYNLLKKKASTAASKARARRSSRSSGSSKLDDVVEEEKTAPTPRRRPSAVPAATSARVAELEDEAESLRVQAAACKQTVDELTEEGDKLRAENKRLRLTEDKARRVHAKCAALKEQLEQLRDENLALGAENGKASAELRASTAKVRFLEEELERVRGEAEDTARGHARELKDVQAQYMDASSRLDQQSRANSDTAGASAAVARSLGEVRKDYEAKLRKAEARAETAEEKAKHLEQELDRMAADVNQVGGWRAAEGSDADSKLVEQYQHRIADLEDELAEAKAGAASRKGARDATMEAADAVAAAASENDQLTQEVSTLNQRLKAAQLLVRKAEKRATQAEDELQALRSDRGAESGSGDGAGAGAEDGSAAAEAPNPRVEAQVRRLQEALDRVRGELAAEKAKVRSLRNNLKTASEALEAAETKVGDLNRLYNDEVAAHREDLEEASGSDERAATLRSEQASQIDSLVGEVETLKADVRAHKQYVEYCKEAAATIHSHGLICHSRLVNMGYEVGPFPQELNELAWSLAQKDSMFSDDITDNGPWQQRMLDGEEEVDVAGDHHPAPSEDDDEDGDTDDAGVRRALAFPWLGHAVAVADLHAMCGLPQPPLTSRSARSERSHRSRVSAHASAELDVTPRSHRSHRSHASASGDAEGDDGALTARSHRSGRSGRSGAGVEAHVSAERAAKAGHASQHRRRRRSPSKRSVMSEDGRM